MILLGLLMLRLLPALTRFLPTMPKSFSHRIHDLAERDANGGINHMILEAFAHLKRRWQTCEAAGPSQVDDPV